MSVKLKVPSVGESVTEVEIGEWLKKEGDHVEKDENVVIIETEKATVEVPAPEAGRLSKILKKQGEGALVGDVIGELEAGKGEAKGGEESGAEGKSEQKPAKSAKADGQPQAKASTASTATPDARRETKDELNAQRSTSNVQRSTSESPKVAPDVRRGSDSGEKTSSQEDVPPRRSGQREEAGRRVMPAAQRVLDEKGIPADKVQATGPGGRVLKEDALRDVSSAPVGKPATPSAPRGPHAADQERPGALSPIRADREEEVVPMSLLRRKIAERLVAAQHNAALLTTFNEIDMTAVMTLRKQYQDRFQERYEIKLGFMSFFVKATIEALKEIPQLNAELRDKEIVYRNYYDIGIAIGGGKGLVVPILRSAERLSFAQIEQGIAELAQRAKDNKLKPDDLQGGTFTITNGGIYGSMLSTPIVNPPQSGVLGMHAIMDRPVAVDGQVVIRPMMYVALTYDHRIVDGREAVTFLKRVKEVIEKPSRMLLEV